MALLNRKNRKANQKPQEPEAELPNLIEMKCWQLLADRNAFCRGLLAKDEDYYPIHPRNDRACKWTATGALIKCYRRPWEPLALLARECWWGEEQRKHWPMLCEFWSAHTDPYLVWAAFKRKDI